jgi:thioredoxin 1
MDFRGGVSKNGTMGYTAEYEEIEPTRADIDAIAGPLLVEFGAPWCGHCQAVQPTLTALLASHPEVRHIKIYDGKGQPLGRSFRVKLWPTLVFLRDGKFVKRLVRPCEAEMQEALNALAGKSSV